MKIVYDHSSSDIDIESKYKNSIINIFNGFYIPFNSKIIYKCKFDDFLKYNKGLFIKITNKSLELYSDIYRSLPFYVYSSNNKTYIYSQLGDLVHFVGRENLTVDEAGFWENLLFSNPLYSRTLFNEIKQNFAASKIEVCKNSISYSYYWNFFVQERIRVNILDDTCEILKNKFILEIDSSSSDNFLMGLSGGMDSRLALSLLSCSNKLNDTNFFTYGYSDKISEVEIAKSLLKELNNWQFHKLDKSSYEFGLEFLSKHYFGSLSFAHSHILSFLKHNSGSNYISTYYSDTIFGYATDLHKSNDTLENLDYYSILFGYKTNIKKNVFDEIMVDLENTFSIYEGSANYSNINEFKYILERTPKFQLNLLNAQASFCKDVFLPFADFELFEHFISLPFKYRYNKSLIRDVIYKLNPSYIDNVGDASNQAVFFKKSISSITKNILTNKTALPLLVIKALNFFLFKISKGKRYIFDKNATEMQANILASEFKDSLNDATSYFEKSGILDHQLIEKINKIDPYGVGNNLRFQLIDLHQSLKNN